MKPDRSWNVVVLWTVATVVGLVIGILSILTLVTGLALGGSSTALVGIVGGAALGAGVGLAQWLVVRQHLRDVSRWVLASTVGGTIGVAIGLVFADALRPLFGSVLTDAVQARPTVPRLLWSSALETGIAGAIAGISLGGAQWLVLRRQVRSAGWWIVVSGLGWMAGLSLSTALIDVGGILVSLLLAGIVVGGMTGMLLAYLLFGGTAPAQHAVGTYTR
jgi:hypothetical protein